MARMTGGEALVQSLWGEGGRVVFGLPGVQIYGAVAALRNDPRIRFIVPRHEQATTFMADGYARAGGGFGTALVVPGPGLLNAASGLSTAYSASSPVLMIAGQVPRENIGKNLGLLHEVHDQLDAVAPVTKWRRRVLRAEDVPSAVNDAVAQLKTGRPRPVAIDMPPEAMEEEAEIDLLPPSQVARTGAPEADLDKAAEMLLRAASPLIYAGGGVHVSGAHEALGAVAEHLQAGVLCSPEGKGAVSDRSDLSLGSALWRGTALWDAVRGADVVLVVGSRLALVAFAPEQRVIQIDVDPEVIGQVHRNTFGLAGDARATLDGLLERLRADSKPRTGRGKEREALRARAIAQTEQEPQASILKSLRASIPDDAILVAGMTQVGYYSRLLWPAYEPWTYLSSSYSGNLGYEYPTALGAKVGRPDRPVVAVIGDGGFLFNAQEMSTAVRYGINVVAVVFNDNAFGNVARDLDAAWGGSYGTDLRNPDFLKFADAFGVFAMRAEDPTGVGDLVRKAVEMDRPALIEVPVGRMARPPFFAPVKGPDKYRR